MSEMLTYYVENNTNNDVVSLGKKFSKEDFLIVFRKRNWNLNDSMTIFTDTTNCYEHKSFEIKFNKGKWIMYVIRRGKEIILETFDNNGNTLSFSKNKYLYNDEELKMEYCSEENEFIEIKNIDEVSFDYENDFPRLE